MQNIKDLTRKKFGRLVVVKLLPKALWKGNRTTYECKCSCGQVKEIRGKSLISGVTRSCGCLIGKFEDLTGLMFGKLKVLELGVKTDINKYKYWKCVCDCGAIKMLTSSVLTSGNTKSCGCMRSVLLKERMAGNKYKLKHGLSRTELYRRQKYVLSVYHLTADQYEQLYFDQDWCCKICGLNESDHLYFAKRRLCVDHNHLTNKVRGLLCDSCNSKLGWYEKQRNRVNTYIG